jgi:glycosyltransferase involved in cell wall biosynthesis
MTRAELGADDDTVLAVYVGALEPPKDPVTPALAAIHLAALGVPIRLALVGDGSLRGPIESMLHQRGGGAIYLAGSRGDVRALLGAADIFVLATQREGLPFSILEAMALGLPCVVSDVPGCVEAIGADGLLVRDGSVAGFSDALWRLALDVDLRHALGTRARARSEMHFSADTMREETAAVYEEALETRRHGA